MGHGKIAQDINVTAKNQVIDTLAVKKVVYYVVQTVSVNNS